MKILYLTQRLPYPPHSGDRIPPYHHIQYLSQKHEIYVGTLLESVDEIKSAAELKQKVAGVGAFYQSKWNSLWQCGWSLLKNQPFSLGYFYNRKLKNQITRWVSENNIETVIVFSSSMAQYIENESQKIRIMNFCDIDSEKWKSLAENTRGIKKWIYRREYILLRKYEYELAKNFSVSCFVTPNEANLFSKWYPEVKVEVLENGVDYPFFSQTPQKPSGHPILTFVGVMNYPPNIEAVLWVAQELWPAVRKRWPQAVFQIVGSKPSAEVLKLKDISGIEVTGFVEDVRNYLGKSTLVIVPLSIARGIQNKILEAMAAGLPLVTTPVAAQGLPSEARSYIWIKERTVNNYLAILEEILGQDFLREKVKDGQRYIKDNVSWESRGIQLENLIHQCQNQTKQSEN